MKAFQNISHFTEFLAARNKLDLAAWAFLPGMLFMAPDKWWGDRGRRALPHEGVDLCFYADPSGKIMSIGEGTGIPVMFGGVIARIIDDFLGESVMVAHGLPGKGQGTFLTIYGHTAPVTGLRAGDEVRPGDVIATVASVKHPNATVRPHLHVSAGTLPGRVPAESLDWSNMGQALALTDPLALIADHYRLIDQA
jgi:murein DD-endopeptidase MepM/ murein hydrolase activator NlpD